MIRSAREEVSACASVLATMKSTPESPETIMLLTALPPAPPTPQTMMRGFNSLSSGAFRVIDISCLITLGARRRRFDFPSTFVWNAPADEDPGSPLEARLQPAPDPSRISAFRACVRRDAARGFEIFESGHLRVDQQTHRRCEGRAFARFGQAFSSKGSPDPRLVGD